MSLLYYFVLALFLLVAFLMIFIILIQENKSMGLGASFGGDAGSSLFGTSTAAVVKKITAWLAFFFFLGCVILSSWTAVIDSYKAPSLYPTAEDDEWVG